MQTHQKTKFSIFKSTMYVTTFIWGLINNVMTPETNMYADTIYHKNFIPHRIAIKRQKLHFTVLPDKE